MQSLWAWSSIQLRRTSHMQESETEDGSDDACGSDADAAALAVGRAGRGTRTRGCLQHRPSIAEKGTVTELSGSSVPVYMCWQKVSYQPRKFAARDRTGVAYSHQRFSARSGITASPCSSTIAVSLGPGDTAFRIRTKMLVACASNGIFDSIQHRHNFCNAQSSHG
jgi:hypothetical protein